MRVNIQYSIDMDMIPTEMQSLVDATVIDALEAVSHALTNLFHNDKPESALTTIHEARQTLFSVDARLSDVDSILKGYIVQRAAAIQQEAEAQEQQASPQVAIPPESGPVETGGAMLPASDDTMSMVRATLAAHRKETETLQRTMNLGFGEEGGDD